MSALTLAAAWVRRTPLRTSHEEMSEKLTAVNDQVGQVKGQVEQNISRALQNTADTGDLAAKSEELHAGSEVFLGQSKKAKQQQCIKNLKMQIALGLVAVIIVAYILYTIFGDE